MRRPAVTGQPGQALPNVLRDQMAANTLGGMSSSPIREVRRRAPINWLVVGLLGVVILAILLLVLLGLAQ